MNEIKESEIETKNLYGASAYAVDEEGNVYRKTHRGVLRKLKTREVCSKTYVTIRNDHGRPWSFDTKRIAQALFKQPIQKYTKQDILELFDVKMIPDWARYVITPYGAVYCIDPPKKRGMVPNWGNTIHHIRRCSSNQMSYRTLQGCLASCTFV